jgi:GT2 family glycosyltransferase
MKTFIHKSRIYEAVVRLGGLFLGSSQRKKSAPVSFHAYSPLRYSGIRTLEQWADVIRRATQSVQGAGSADPQISVITPTWNTRVSWFSQAAVSLLEQSCADWEWCIIDDASTQTDFQSLFPVLETSRRVKIRKLSEHVGISGAMNEGLSMASADSVCFLDHDDLLAPAALAECLRAMDGGLDAVYTDEDKVNDDGVCAEPFYKPDWSPEYFRCVMYIGHLLCVRRDMALKINGFDGRFNGVQDFEFMLRYSEQTSRIGHLSAILYHWRTAPGSVASSQDAKGELGGLQRQAVQEHLERLHFSSVAEVGRAKHTIQIRPSSLDDHPTVSIILAGADPGQRILSNITGKTTYDNYEIICMNSDRVAEQYLPSIRSDKVRHIEFEGDANSEWARNVGARHAMGEFLVFINPDVEVITVTWIEKMLYYARQRDVGAVGGLVVYSDLTVRHAGIVVAQGGVSVRLLHKAPADSIGCFGVLCCSREVSAVTAECMMIKRRLFESTGGFSGIYSFLQQDVELCLRLRSLGLRNVYTPQARFGYLGANAGGIPVRDKDICSQDPYYNRNLDFDVCDYTAKCD